MPHVLTQRKIYIHIGTHKTGTTSIQSFLMEQRAALANTGIYIPKSGVIYAGHHLIAWELRGDKRCDPPTGHIAALLEELSRCTQPSITISAEDFEYLQRYPLNLRVFVEQLRAINLTPVFVVMFRNTADYAESLRQEMARHGAAESKEWFEAELQQHQAITVNGDWYHEFNRQRFVSTWKEITQCELIVLDYDKCQAGLGVVPSFMVVIGASNAIVALAKNAPRLNTRIQNVA